MNEREVWKMLRPIDSVDEIVWSHFGNACQDPHATIAAVNDFASFARIMNSGAKRKMRKDRLEKLYGLYLAISKTQLPLSKEILEKFRQTVPGYERVSLFYFVTDICRLRSAGVVIVSTPIMDALARARASRQFLQAYQRRFGEQDSDSQPDEKTVELQLSNVRSDPPTVWPDL